MNGNGNVAASESVPAAPSAAPSASGDPAAAPAEGAVPAAAVAIDAAAAISAVVASATPAAQPAPQNGPQQGGAPQQHGHQQHGQHGSHNRHPNQNQNRNQQHQRHQQQPRPPEQTFPVEGFLDVDHRGNGRLRMQKFNFVSQPDDPEVPRHLIDRDKLRAGSLITGQSVKRNGRLQMTRIESVEGLPPAQVAARTLFQNLTVIDPDDRLVMETTGKEILTRVIDIVAPIGLGQRA